MSTSTAPDDTIYIAHFHKCTCERRFPCIEVECRPDGPLAAAPRRCNDCKLVDILTHPSEEQGKLRLVGDITFRKSRGHENSVAAHKRTDKQKDCLRVLDFLRARGWAGATCEEISIELSMPYTTASGRCSELKGLRPGTAQLIMESGRKRPTTRGSNAAVLILKNP